MSQVLYQVVFSSCLYALKLGEAPCTNTHPRCATARDGMLPRTALVAEQLAAVSAVMPPPVQVERMTAVATRCCVLITLPLVAG